MKNKMMVDCETLGVGESPVILQIGAVIFDDNGIYGHFSVGIDTTNATEHGFTIEKSTLDWWKDQDPELRKQVFSGEELLPFALQKLVNFYQNYECNEIWSKGSLADIRWINNALDHFEIERPWKYYKEFCFRTLLKSFPKFDLPFVGVPHNALDDAIHQAKQFIEIKKIQKG
ncbi:3'-5' exoribonuclease [Acinetobacter soli]|uniref:3'-5' exonuclease n=1 Tax=Acinetobacter soli TaxID=487316 RepID=UPI001F17F474|nr:3'-5' exonuclease [Acinetobacter soli]MCF3128476.1 3'-5' exoribonuclease [Acinetobacter soli]